MHSGRGAGVRTAAAQWGPFSRAELAVAAPDYWMKTITELPGIVATLSR
jgi:pyrophosphatase PpaX